MSDAATRHGKAYVDHRKDGPGTALSEAAEHGGALGGLKSGRLAAVNEDKTVVSTITSVTFMTMSTPRRTPTPNCPAEVKEGTAESIAERTVRVEAKRATEPPIDTGRGGMKDSG